MTAEIAILNKSAVALATDSAVTIGQPPNAKIYNTVNKIFELSAHAPVGVMVYGRLDFMGLPFETIIKEYRKTLGKTKYPKISDYCSAFREYLTKDVPVPQRESLLNVVLILQTHFEALNRKFDQAVREDMRHRGAFLPGKLNRILQTLVRSEITAAKSTPFSTGFTRKVLPPTTRVLWTPWRINAFMELRPRRKAGGCCVNGLATCCQSKAYLECDRV